MKTIDEQLEEALARITQLESDATASAALLSDAGHQHERYQQQIATLTGERDALAASAITQELATAKDQIATLTREKESLTLANGELTDQRDQFCRDLAAAKELLKTAEDTEKQLTAAKQQISTLTQEVETLKANAKSAERIAAEHYGAASPQPVPVTPRGDSEATTLVEKFKAITDPAAQTAFWRSLTSEQRTLILNAQ